MSTETKKPPVQTMRLGPLKCSIWMNPGTEGKLYYSATIIRVYRLPPEKCDEEDKFDEGWRETNSMKDEDLVLLHELSRRASAWINIRLAEEAAPDF